MAYFANKPEKDLFMKKARWLFILLLLLPVNLHAGSFRHLNRIDGLSSRSVYSLEKDSAGFIWFFTLVGVDRYDGTAFRHYSLENIATTGKHQPFTSIRTFDNRGFPWVAHINGDIYAYDPMTDRFSLRIPLSKHTEEANSLQAIFFDNDNRLWASIASELYYFDQEANRLIHVPGFPEGLVTSLLQTDAHTWYIGTQTHLFRLQRKDGQTVFKSPETVPLPAANRIESLHQTEGKLYAGTFSNGVFIVDTATLQVRALACIPAGSPVRAIKATRRGRVLIGTDGAGLYRIDPKTDTIIRQYQADEDQLMGLAGNTISDLYVDEENRIWVSTSTNGVTIYDPVQPDVNWKRHEYMNRNSLVSDHVNTILEDSDGDIWYGTNNGISLYLAKDDRWIHFLDEKEQSNSHPVVVLALCEDSEKQVWAGSFGIGTYRIDKRSGAIHKMKTRRHPEAKDGIATDYIYTIHADGEKIWLGGIQGALTCYNQRTGEYSYTDVECIGDIKAGEPHQLLMATCSGLGILDTRDGDITWYNQFGSDRLQYPIRSLTYSREGVIWMATSGNGLVRFDPRTQQSAFYTLENGLDSNTILNVVQDAEGRIWFSTDKTLYLLDTHSGKITDMNEYVRVNGSNYNPNANLLRSNGNLVFGTASGAWGFETRFRIERKESPRLLLTGFSLFHQLIEAGDKPWLNEAIDLTNIIRLGYTENYFSIHFSSLNFTNPMQVAYEYKLQGYETDWHRAGSERLADYSSVKPGNYTFFLRMVNNFSGEVLAERSLRIQVDKPIWASAWAWGLYLLLACGLIGFIIHYIRKRMDEHDAREKIRSFIHLAHDIRIPVTLIKAPLTELEGNENLSPQGRKSVTVALENADKLFAMVTQLLDLQKTDAQADKMHMEWLSIYDFMQEKVTAFRQDAIRKGIELVMEADPDMPDGYFDRASMDKIMDNLLSNALKYTEKGTVAIRLTHNREEWSVAVSDSGIGIPTQDLKHIFKEFYRAGNTVNSNLSGSGIGLVLTRKLVRLNQGRINVSSTENKGSTFLLTFPLNRRLLPRKPTTTTTSLPDDIPERATTSEPETILLAEDSDDMREYLADSLSKTYRVIIAKDGAEALEQAHELNPDIIISDIIMPALRGDEMCRILKSSMETSHIPVILLTALNDKEHIIRGLEAGADDYVTKPFDFAVLKVRIRNILQSRERMRRMILSTETGLDDLHYANTLDKAFLDKAIRIIEAELANPGFSINDFCRELGMSRTSAYNKIKTLTDQAPNDFIRIIRLNRAQDLLRSKKHPIAEVALMVGFSDPKYFSTSFKKQFGISPSKVE